MKRSQHSYGGSLVARKRFTHLQGQYLAFIHAYTRIHGVPPAEADLQRFFGVTPPSVHDMIVRLHTLGLISRSPGAARSIRIRVPEQEIPVLDPSPRHGR
ncbi:MAG: LexA family protein [Longimicrobiales bacterium]